MDSLDTIFNLQILSHREQSEKDPREVRPRFELMVTNNTILLKNYNSCMLVISFEAH